MPSYPMQMSTTTPWKRSKPYLDHPARTTHATDGSQAVMARYDYDPYGRRTKLSGSGESVFGFTGHPTHGPTRLALTLFRAYDPEVGRWLAEDPLGTTGGLNLYAYVDNRPVLFVDEFGLRPKLDWMSMDTLAIRSGSGRYINDFWNEFGAGIGMMWSNYQQMVSAKARGTDRYFHCMANCQASKEGLGGRTAAQTISYVREIYGRIKGDPWYDTALDLAANESGRRCSVGVPCTDRCRVWLPKSLPKGFPRI